MASTVNLALCLEGLVPVPSGLAVTLDGGPVPRHVRDSRAPEGVVHIHLGSGTLGASRVTEALLRQHPATISRMVEILSPERTRSITRGEVDDRGRAHGLPVDLPGRADLLVPGDDRILPMDDAGRVTTAGAATGVRVLPERHLLDSSPLLTTTSAAPRLPAMHGQVRLSGDTMAIGLPSALVAARHGDLVDVRPTGGGTVTVTGPAELIRQLDLLTPGQRAVVDVRRTEGAQSETFHILRDPDGLGVLTFAGGTPTAVTLPRAAFSIEVSLPPMPAEVAANATIQELDPAFVAEDADYVGAPQPGQVAVGVEPVAWGDLDVVKEVVGEKLRPESRWLPVKNAVRAYGSIPASKVGDREMQLNVIAGSLRNWREHHRWSATNLTNYRTANWPRISRLRGLADALDGLIGVERTDIEARRAAAPAVRGAVPMTIAARSGQGSREVFTPFGTPSPVNLPRLGRHFEESPRLPNGVQVQMHTTTRSNYPAIAQQGLHPGRGTGVGLPTGGSDRTYVYTLTGSVPQTTTYVMQDARASAPVGVLTTGRDSVRDVNYRSGGARMYGGAIAPVRDFSAEDVAASYSFTFPVSPPTARGMTDFVNYQRSAQGEAPLTQADVLQRVRGDMFRLFGIYVADYLFLEEVPRPAQVRAAAPLARYAPSTPAAPVGYPVSYAPSRYGSSSRQSASDVAPAPQRVPSSQDRPSSGRRHRSARTSPPSRRGRHGGSYLADEDLFDFDDYGRAPASGEGKAPRTDGRSGARETPRVSRQDIDGLREQVSPRVLKATTVIDVAERMRPPEPVIPWTVADSYRRAGLELAAFVPVKPNLKARLRDMAYDHRTLVTADGGRVQDFVLRLHPRPSNLEAAAAFPPDRLRRIEQAVDDFYNQKYRIGPDDDQFNVTLRFAATAADAHRQIALVGDARGTTQVVWSPETSDLDIVHEVAHFLGLFDEYSLTGANSFVDHDGVSLRWVLRRHDAAHDNSIMRTTDPADRPELKPRNLDHIAAVPAAAFQPDRDGPATAGTAQVAQAPRPRFRPSRETAEGIELGDRIYERPEAAPSWRGSDRRLAVDSGHDLADPADATGVGATPQNDAPGRTVDALLGSVDPDAGAHLFVISTAADGAVDHGGAPALDDGLVDQLISGLRQQYPDAEIQLMGPDPDGRLSRVHPEAMVFTDALRVGAVTDRDALLDRLGAAGATVIGVTPDVLSLPAAHGLRTLWLGGQAQPDDPVETGNARSQRLDLPVGWDALRDAADRASAGLPQAPDVLRDALDRWRESVRRYQRSMAGDQSRPGEVGWQRSYRHDIARRLGDLLDQQLAGLDRDPRGAAARWNEFRPRADVHVADLSVLTSTEMFGFLRRAVDDHAAFGAPVVPEKIKNVEIFPPGQEDVVSPGTIGRPTRMNPLWTSLADLTAEHFTLRSGATWQFIVTPGNALPRFGSESVSKVVSERQWAQLRDFRAEAARRAVTAELTGAPRPVNLAGVGELGGPTTPAPLDDAQIAQLSQQLDIAGLARDNGVPVPSPARARQILELPEVRRVLTSPESAYDGLGHPTDGGAFAEDGAFVSQELQVGGEVTWNAEAGLLVFNDMSGRSMSPKVRPTEPERFKIWVGNVARMVQAQTGLAWDFGLSKQAAKGALKTNPRDIEALAKVSIVKAGLPDRAVVERFRQEADRLRSRVDAFLTRVPPSEVRTAATSAWHRLLEGLGQAGGSPITTAEEAVRAYADAVQTTRAAAGRRVLPDPAYFFPTRREDLPSGWWIGPKAAPDTARSAAARAGVVEVRFRDRPDTGDLGLLRVALLNQPLDELRRAVYVPADRDLGERDFDAQRRADEVGLPVDIPVTKERLLAAPPDVKVWLDRHGREVPDRDRAHHLRVRPRTHLAEEHLDRGVVEPGPVDAPVAAPLSTRDAPPVRLLRSDLTEDERETILSSLRNLGSRHDTPVHDWLQRLNPPADLLNDTTQLWEHFVRPGDLARPTTVQDLVLTYERVHHRIGLVAQTSRPGSSHPLPSLREILPDALFRTEPVTRPDITAFPLRLGIPDRLAAAASVLRATKARESRLSDHLGVRIGSVAEGSKAFDHSVLDRVEGTLAALPSAHVRDNPQLAGVRRVDGSQENSASEYSRADQFIDIVYPAVGGVPMPGALYSRLDRGVSWQRRRMDAAVLASLPGVSPDGDRSLGVDPHGREVMAGVSAVLAHGNLVEWTVRHETGHAVDARAGWLERFSGEQRFGGWRRHGNSDGFRVVATAMLAQLNVDPTAHGHDDLLIVLADMLDLPHYSPRYDDLSRDLDWSLGLERRMAALSTWFPILDPARAHQLGEFIRQALTPDLVTLNGRRYGFGPYSGWFSYRVRPNDVLDSRTNYRTNTVPDLARDLVAAAGVAQAPYAANLREYLDGWLWRAARTHDVSFLDALRERFPDLPAAARRRIDDFVRLGLAQPWTLRDAGGDVLRLGDRMYHVSPSGGWVSYLETERTRHGLSNYQFSDPGEWFAEAYAAMYDTVDAPRERLNPAVREWFTGELPRLLEGIGGGPEPEWLRTALERQLNRPAPNLVTNAGTTAGVPETLIKAAKGAKDKPGVRIYFHEAKRGAALGAGDRAAIHQRLEQFAQAGIRLLVVTPGRPSLDVLSVLDTYGATLVSEVPAGLGFAWRATARNRTGAAIESPEITSDLLRSAAEASGAAPKVNRVLESFGSLVWASAGLWDQHRKIADAPSEYHTDENLRAADEMAERMPDSAEAHLIKSLLQFGRSDIVPRFVEAPKEDRPSLLLKELRKLELSGHPVYETGKNTTALVSLVEATGKGINDKAALNEIRFTTAILKTLNAISAGQWDDAEKFISEHTGLTDARQRKKWAEAIEARQKNITDHGERLHLQNLIIAVFKC
ncbi:hypothetical protein ACFY3U_11630 [Micromonospora sp. NPDC000089]|uniref:hypothetical protein n=1 Tax=unclassified Micromonospora TaxID=2617518 RepID=UPI00367E3584